MPECPFASRRFTNTTRPQMLIFLVAGPSLVESCVRCGDDADLFRCRDGLGVSRAQATNGAASQLSQQTVCGSSLSYKSIPLISRKRSRMGISNVRLVNDDSKEGLGLVVVVVVVVLMSG